MLRFFLGRLAVLIPTFLGVALVAFSFIRLLPGDPVLVMAGEKAMSQERHDALMHDLGFDQPLPLQFLNEKAGSARISDTVPRNSGTIPVCDHSGCRSGHSGWCDCRRQARHLARPIHHGCGPDRLFHAHFLVGPSADHLLFWLSALDAGVRANFADVFLPAAHGLHAHR